MHLADVRISERIAAERQIIEEKRERDKRAFKNDVERWRERVSKVFVVLFCFFFFGNRYKAFCQNHRAHLKLYIPFSLLSDVQVTRLEAELVDRERAIKNEAAQTIEEMEKRGDAMYREREEGLVRECERRLADNERRRAIELEEARREWSRELEAERRRHAAEITSIREASGKEVRFARDFFSPFC
jgi:hypothetical protein